VERKVKLFIVKKAIQLDEAYQEHNSSEHRVNVSLPHYFEVNLENLAVHSGSESFSFVFSFLILVFVRVERLVHIFFKYLL
jgi:hypothetical protein